MGNSQSSPALLLEAAEAGDTATVQAIINSTPNPVQLLSATTGRFHGNKTVLHLAAQAGQATIISSLLQPLVEAVATEMAAGTYPDTAAACLQATINREDSRGRSPLLSSCERGQWDCAEVLLEAGSNVFAVDRDGNSSLHLACVNGHLALVLQLLLKAEAQAVTHRLINCQNFGGFTPLHYAAWGGRADVARQLLAAGADQRLESSADYDRWLVVPVGSTALHTAALQQHAAVCLALLQQHALEVREWLPGEPRPADPRALLNATGSTPLQLAVWKGLNPSSQLAACLNPRLAVAALFTPFELDELRRRGPLALKVLAAKAVSKHLLQELDTLQQLQQHQAQQRRMQRQYEREQRLHQQQQQQRAESHNWQRWWLQFDRVQEQQQEQQQQQEYREQQQSRASSISSRAKSEACLLSFSSAAASSQQQQPQQLCQQQHFSADSGIAASDRDWQREQQHAELLQGLRRTPSVTLGAVQYISSRHSSKEESDSSSSSSSSSRSSTSSSQGDAIPITNTGDGPQDCYSADTTTVPQSTTLAAALAASATDRSLDGCSTAAAAAAGGGGAGGGDNCGSAAAAAGTAGLLKRSSITVGCLNRILVFTEQRQQQVAAAAAGGSTDRPAIAGAVSPDTTAGTGTAAAAAAAVAAAVAAAAAVTDSDALFEIQAEQEQKEDCQGSQAGQLQQQKEEEGQTYQTTATRNASGTSSSSSTSSHSSSSSSNAAAVPAASTGAAASAGAGAGAGTDGDATAAGSAAAAAHLSAPYKYINAELHRSTGAMNEFALVSLQQQQQASLVSSSSSSTTTNHSRQLSAEALIGQPVSQTGRTSRHCGSLSSSSITLAQLPAASSSSNLTAAAAHSSILASVKQQQQRQQQQQQQQQQLPGDFRIAGIGTASGSDWQQLLTPFAWKLLQQQQQQQQDLAACCDSPSTPGTISNNSSTKGNAAEQRSRSGDGSPQQVTGPQLVVTGYHGQATASTSSSNSCTEPANVSTTSTISAQLPGCSSSSAAASTALPTPALTQPQPGGSIRRFSLGHRRTSTSSGGGCRSMSHGSASHDGSSLLPPAGGALDKHAGRLQPPHKAGGRRSFELPTSMHVVFGASTQHVSRMMLQAAGTSMTNKDPWGPSGGLSSKPLSRAGSLAVATSLAGALPGCVSAKLSQLQYLEATVGSSSAGTSSVVQLAAASGTGGTGGTVTPSLAAATSAWGDGISSCCSADYTCAVCFDKPPAVALDGCCHVLCFACAGCIVQEGVGCRPPLCPFCRKTITGFELAGVACSRLGD